MVGRFHDPEYVHIHGMIISGSCLPGRHGSVDECYDRGELEAWFPYAASQSKMVAAGISSFNWYVYYHGEGNV